MLSHDEKNFVISSSVNKYGLTGVGREIFPAGMTYADVYPRPIRYLENARRTDAALYRFPGVSEYLFKNAFIVSLLGMLSSGEQMDVKSRYLFRWYSAVV